MEYKILKDFNCVKKDSYKEEPKPTKCIFCNSEDLESKCIASEDIYGVGIEIPTEFLISCKSCLKELGIESYGTYISKTKKDER